MAEKQKRSWLSSKHWHRELIIWFFWSFAITGSLIAITIGIWPLAIHLTLMAVVVTIFFRLVTRHKHPREDFKVDTEIFKP